MVTLANIAKIELSKIYRSETGKINPKLNALLLMRNALGKSLRVVLINFVF